MPRTERTGCKLNFMSKNEKPEPAGPGALPPEPSKATLARPYGDCYEASFKSAEELAQLKSAAETNPTDKDLKRLYDGLGLTEEIEIVHGAAVPPDGLDQGRTVFHAWVEVGGNVIESSNGQLQEYPAADYYEHFKIEVLHRYSVAEARDLAQKYKVYGLWHDMQ